MSLLRSEELRPLLFPSLTALCSLSFALSSLLFALCPDAKLLQSCVRNLQLKLIRPKLLIFLNSTIDCLCSLLISADCVHKNNLKVICHDWSITQPTAVSHRVANVAAIGPQFTE